MVEERGRKRIILVGYDQPKKLEGNSIYISFGYVNKGIEARVVSDEMFSYQGKPVKEASEIFGFNPDYKTLVRRVSEENGGAEIVDTLFMEGLNACHYFEVAKVIGS